MILIYANIEIRQGTRSLSNGITPLSPSYYLLNEIIFLPLHMLKRKFTKNNRSSANCKQIDSNQITLYLISQLSHHNMSSLCKSHNLNSKFTLNKEILENHTPNASTL